MRILSLFLGGISILFVSGFALAEDTFVPEKISVEAKIKPGPNVFVLDQSWMGASRVNVMSADTFTNKGNLSIGLIGQFALSKDHKTAFATSIYPKRILYGPLDTVLQEFDVETLSVKREIPISNKMAQSSPQASYLTLSSDERYVYIQNATPATSVSVVDLSIGKQIAEIPIPGCAGIFPALQERRFSSLCGDGTVTSYAFKADGTLLKPVKSSKIFDADKDALYVQGVRADKELLFMSFNGNVYRISDANEAASLIEKFSIIEGIEGGWAPGAVSVMAYNKAHQVLFVSMHPNAEEGSHKATGTEAWAINLKTRQLLYRSAIAGATSLAVTQGDKPVLYAIDADTTTLSRYDVDPSAKFAAKFSGKVGETGKYGFLVWVSE